MSVDIPRIFLATPRYGLVSAEAWTKKMYCGTQNCKPESQVIVVENADCDSSALVHNFNMLFAEAMCWRDNGQATHFAMLHSDLFPEGYFLNLLWDVMRPRNLVLVAAVSPIKDPLPGRTSTAISKRDNVWSEPRYIQLSDRHKMPETFETKDVCGPDELLYVNTGCFLADLRHPCWDTFAFGTDTQITTTPDGGRKAWFLSEDWKMSRHLDACGARYAATWAVRLRHQGLAWWDSHIPAKTCTSGVPEGASLFAKTCTSEVPEEVPLALQAT